MYYFGRECECDYKLENSKKANGKAEKKSQAVCPQG